MPLQKIGKFDISDVTRLPDIVSNDIGVFIDLSFDYNYFEIYQDSPRNKLLNQMECISFKVLKNESFISGRFEYE